jgi:hypothetical protein
MAANVASRHAEYTIAPYVGSGHTNNRQFPHQPLLDSTTACKSTLHAVCTVAGLAEALLCQLLLAYMYV